MQHPRRQSCTSPLQRGSYPRREGGMAGTEPEQEQGGSAWVGGQHEGSPTPRHSPFSPAAGHCPPLAPAVVSCT